MRIVGDLTSHQRQAIDWLVSSYGTGRKLKDRLSTRPESIPIGYQHLWFRPFGIAEWNKYIRVGRRLYYQGRIQFTEKKNPSSLYQSFHGNPPSRLRKVKLPIPKEGERLLAIGRLISLVYLPYGSSQRKGTYFEHQFGDDGRRIYPEKPILCTDSQGKHLYILPDKSGLYVNERGIIK